MREKDLKEIIFDIKNKLKNILQKYFKLIFISILILLFLILISIYSNLYNKKYLYINFLDIGQGDAILIETAQRKNILIDAGVDSKIIASLENKISIFDRNIDMAIMTHPDLDHVGGFFYVFKKFKIKNILQNVDIGENSILKEIDKELNKKNSSSTKTLYANCGDKIVFPDDHMLQIFILHPDKNNLSTKGTNENSIVALLIYGDYSFLFTGDIDKDTEKKIFFDLQNCFSGDDINKIENALKNLTVLKVSHHGSSTASSEYFLKKVKPEYAVISAGENNRFGHPDKEVLELLNRYSKNVLNTINDGDITFKTDGKNLEIIKEK